jgi:hypothetical protein
VFSRLLAILPFSKDKNTQKNVNKDFKHFVVKDWLHLAYEDIAVYANILQQLLTPLKGKQLFWCITAWA